MKSMLKEGFNKFEAVIFDMDGLLVDSEPLWHIAEIEVFKTIGIELTIEDCLKTTGMPTKDVLEFWYNLKPWTNKTFDEVSADLYTSIKKLIAKEATLMPGALELLVTLKKAGLKIGLASASPMEIIELSISSLNVKSYFDFYHSAVLEKNNKPHPDVYLKVAKILKIDIEKCIILEDSVNGIKGAIASGAFAVAVPDLHFYDNSEFLKANLKVKNLAEFKNLMFNSK